MEKEASYLDEQAKLYQKTIDFWTGRIEKLVIIKDELSDEEEDSPSNLEIDDALAEALIRLDYEKYYVAVFERRLRVFLKKKKQGQ